MKTGMYSVIPRATTKKNERDSAKNQIKWATKPLNNPKEDIEEQKTGYREQIIKW